MKKNLAVRWVALLLCLSYSCTNSTISYSQTYHPVTSPKSINDVREGFGRINIVRFPGENPGHGQSFTVDSEIINGIEVYLVSTANGFEDDVTLQLRDVELNVLTETTKKIRTPLERWVDFKFDNPVKIDSSQKYSVFVFAKKTTIHWAYGPGKYKWGEAIINTKVDKDYDYYFHIY